MVSKDQVNAHLLAFIRGSQDSRTPRVLCFGSIQQSAQFGPAHAGVVGRRAGLELLSPRERADDDGIESRIANEVRSRLHR